MSKKTGAGRPTVVTEEAIRKLETSFANGFTDIEACVYADIGTTAFYNYCKLNEEFAERKEMLKQQPGMKAKLNISRELDDGDVDVSKWYLERKDPEYSNRNRTEIKGSLSVSNPFDGLTDEQVRKIAESSG